MKNIEVLWNFPEYVNMMIQKIFYDHINDEPEYTFRVPSMDGKSAPSELKEYIRDTFPVHIERGNIEIFTVYPGATPNPHIDRGRISAIQIPLNYSTDNFITYSIKDGCEDKLEVDPIGVFSSAKADVVNYSTAYHFIYDEKYFDAYSCEMPYIQKVSSVHTGANFSSEYRHFVSIKVKNMSYEETIERFKCWI